MAISSVPGACPGQGLAVGGDDALRREYELRLERLQWGRSAERHPTSQLQHRGALSRRGVMNERRCRGVGQKVTSTCMASNRASIGLREQRPTKKRQKNQWS